VLVCWDVVAEDVRDVDVDVDVVGAGICELGIAGSSGTAVCFLATPLAITSAMARAATSSTAAAAAATHSHRGAFGRPGVLSGVR
jgi:hypothetical protein